MGYHFRISFLGNNLKSYPDHQKISYNILSYPILSFHILRYPRGQTPRCMHTHWHARAPVWAAPAAHALASCRSRPYDSERDATVRRCARARGMLVPPRSRMAAGAHTLAAKVRHTVERKHYAGSRGTVCDIVRDSDVTSNEIYCCLGWTCLLQIAVTEGFNTAHLMIAENQF